jgi:predicted transport protein
VETLQSILNDSKNLPRGVSRVDHSGNGDYEIIIKEHLDIGHQFYFS